MNLSIVIIGTLGIFLTIVGMEENEIVIKTEKPDSEQFSHNSNQTEKELLVEGCLLPSLQKPIQTKEKRYICDYVENGTICNKSFTTNGNLSQHKRMHTGEKEYICDYVKNGTPCNKAFSERSILIIHKRVHTGEKPYICDYVKNGIACNKPFSQSGNLNKHKRKHTGEKPYMCDYVGHGTVCNKTFSENGNLTKHKRIHPKMLNNNLENEKSYSVKKTPVEILASALPLIEKQTDQSSS